MYITIVFRKCVCMRVCVCVCVCTCCDIEEEGILCRYVCHDCVE
jgi:hypothetical protein